jgi:hypothetical protein
MRRGSLVLIIVLLLLTLPAVVAADSHKVSMRYTSYDPLSGDGRAENSWCRLGQAVNITDRHVASIGYNVWRIGNATGDIILSIRDIAEEEDENMVIFSKVWGDASELAVWGTGPNPIEVTLDEPMYINAMVRICVEYYDGDMDNYCCAGYYSGDRVTGEWYTNYRYGQWIDIGEAEEGSYLYTWVDPEDIETQNEDTIPFWPIAPLGAALGGLWFYVNRRQHKKRETN